MQALAMRPLYESLVAALEADVTASAMYQKSVYISFLGISRICIGTIRAPCLLNSESSMISFNVKIDLTAPC